MDNLTSSFSGFCYSWSRWDDFEAECPDLIALWDVLRLQEPDAFSHSFVFVRIS